MVSDTHFTRVFQAGAAAVAIGALVLACAPFSEALGDAPPVDSRRSDDPTLPLGDGGTKTDAAKAQASDAATPSPPPAACNGTASCERVVFVTSEAVTGGTIHGVLGADLLCNRLAALSSNPRVTGRTFVAWLSDDTRSPSTSMVHGTGAYVRPDGVRIASDYAQLTGGGPLEMPIEIDERGQQQQGDVWSATSPSGARDGDTCYGWSSESAVGARGAISAEAGRWTRTSGTGYGDGEPMDCSGTMNRIYCFER
ncbi:MAG: surface antigen protein [Myxococcaceae bacterium]|jgi:hypothetical protein|nr:surface antigen protein [Myxococcaceae bacterium]MEA2749772.1 hypothetical protein [Myxococcales bacterium]